MSALEIFDCEQNSDDWFRVRMGMPTASEFSTVLSVGRGGGEFKSRRTYLYKLAGERITEEPMERGFESNAMKRGKLLEPEARDYYHLITDRPLTRVGFIKNQKKGCSPDSLIEKNGMLEVKTQAPHLLIETLEDDTIPPEHYAQLQGNLWVAERDWIDLLIYFPKMPASLRRIYRDDPYIVTLAKAVDRFNEELDALEARIRARQ